MAAPKVNGFTIAYTAAGAVIAWSGIKGTTLSTTVRDLLAGQAPAQDQEPITGTAAAAAAPGASAAPGDTGAASASAAANQALGKLLAAPYGWATGTQWEDLVSLWNQESGWNNEIKNQSSGAYGIAQALGHGQGAATQGTQANEYGGYGVSDAVAQAANSGSAAAQITWGLAYIKATYGSPSAAWANEETEGAY